MADAPENPPARRELKRGAIALVDALGFKGIWRQMNGPDVLDLMAAVNSEVTRAAELLNGVERDFAASSQPPFSFVHRRVLFVSDSVFVAVWPRHNPTAPDAAKMCVHWCAALCKKLAISAALRSHHLKYRGVITYGDFDVHPEQAFVVGPAVDEVAALEREADGAFIWLTPRAAAALQPADDVPPNTGTPWHHVPFKGGRTLYVPVLNLIHGLPEDEQKTVLRSLLRPNPPDAPFDAHVKRGNLIHFFDRWVPAAPMRAATAPDSGDAD